MFIREKYAARVGTPTEIHKFLNTPVIYDRWAVYSSNYPFKLLGKMNHPEGCTMEQLMDAARKRFGEHAPVLQDLAVERAESREAEAGYYKGRPINELGF